MPHLLHQIYIVDWVILRALSIELLIDESRGQILLTVKRLVRISNHDLFKHGANDFDFLPSSSHVLFTILKGHVVVQRHVQIFDILARLVCIKRALFALDLVERLRL